MKKQDKITRITILILIIIALTQTIQAVTTYETINGATTQNIGGSISYYNAQRILPKTTGVAIYNVTKHSSCTATKAYIYDNSGIQYGSTITFSGDVASFSTPVNVTNATFYWVLVDNSGSNYALTDQSSPTYNYTGTSLWITGHYEGTTVASVVNGTRSTTTFRCITKISTITTTYTTSNFSINASSIWNSSAITTFNATDGTNSWGTTTGRIITNHLQNDTDTINLTIFGASGYNNRTYTNQATTSNITVELYPTDTTNPSIYCSLNNVTNVSGYNTTLNITITEPFLTNVTITPEGLTTQTNNSYMTNFFYGSTTWNITNIQGIGDYTIQVDATDLNGNTENYTCNYTIIPDNNYIYLYIYDYLNTTLITNVKTYDNTTATNNYDNPYNQLTSLFGLTKANTWNNQQISIEDLDMYNIPKNTSINITRHNWNFSTTMTPNKLSITFINSTNQSVTVTGSIIDEYPSERSFNNTNILIVQTNLSLGKVIVRFNDNENWTQYYEYINDYTTYINETIEIINKSNLWYGYILVKDKTGSPISDVTIRATAVKTNWITNYSTGSLIGQRLTEEDGYTFFIAEKTHTVLFSIYKDGYEAQEKLITFGDENFVRSDPLIVVLKGGQNNVSHNIYGYVPSQIRNLSSNIDGTIVAWDYKQIEIQTDYRNRTGSGPKDITNLAPWLGRHTFELVSCIDFNCTSGNTDDIILSIYADNTFITNWTIINYHETPTNIFPTDETPNVRTKIASIIALIALLITVTLMNLIMKESRAGFHTFMTGTIVLAIINPNYFIWLGAIGVIYYIFQLIKTLISE